MSILLAGDIGGTKTVLGLFDAATDPPSRIRTSRYPTADFDGLASVLATFLEGTRTSIAAACFGLAGPVRGPVAELTNVAWRVESTEIAERFTIPRIRLLNDVVAMAYAIPTLTDSQLEVLQTGSQGTGGNAALLAAGTGLGEALLHDLEGRVVPVASEGGHADFAARTAEELAFVRTLSAQAGRVAYEQVVSGPGLLNLHRFVHESRPCTRVTEAVPQSERPSLIAGAGIDGTCAGCVEALNMFVSALGAEAGNLGLRSVATAGVFLGGGIPRQILPALRRPNFLKAFRAKGPMTHLVASMPVAVILEPDVALVGAAVAADHA